MSWNKLNETYLTTYGKKCICGKLCNLRKQGDRLYQPYGRIHTVYRRSCAGILKQNGYKVEVKVFKELKTYLERMDYLNAHKQELEQNISFKPDERYPDLSRDQLIKHTILAISL